ncbi:hypothetical protein TNCV_2958371 [Trichonephila clavipes]|nr:hypothetical protein TNCV_2958371 [Trichonephila clavipes]
MLPNRQRPDRDPRNSSWPRKFIMMPVVSRNFEHHTGDSMIWLVSTPILREDIWGWSGASHPLPPASREDLWLDGYLEYPPCHEGTIHLQTSMSSPWFEPMPYGTAVSVANHYTGCVTHLLLLFHMAESEINPLTSDHSRKNNTASKPKTKNLELKRDKRSKSKNTPTFLS